MLQRDNFSAIKPRGTEECESAVKYFANDCWEQLGDHREKQDINTLSDASQHLTAELGPVLQFGSLHIWYLLTWGCLLYEVRKNV
jgi:hypothetical protein